MILDYIFFFFLEGTVRRFVGFKGRTPDFSIATFGQVNALSGLQNNLREGERERNGGRERESIKKIRVSWCSEKTLHNIERCFLNYQNWKLNI